MGTIILECNLCGAKFKIRNPQPGAAFACHRCHNTICIPGSSNQETSDPSQVSLSTPTAAPDIVKIELPKACNIAPSTFSESPPISEQPQPSSDLTASQSLDQDQAQSTPSSLPTSIGQHIQTSSQNPTDESIPSQQTTKKTSSNVSKRILSVSRRDICNSNNNMMQTPGNKKIFADDLQNRQRLLYLISLYTKLAEREKKGTWIRKLPLQVFMFEGIVAEIFDWDYAPTSVFHGDGRCFVNVSQEGEEDLLTLLSNGYVHNLKLTTNQHRNITAYQITKKGLDCLSQIPESDKKLVDSLVQCPKCSNLLWASKHNDKIYLYCSKKCGYHRISSITQAEDVSYFCTPYFVPSLSKFPYHRASDLPQRLQSYFSKHPQDNIKDTLEELIYLGQVKVLVSEWIPFGSNHLAALNYKLGSHERVQSAKFTQQVDCSPHGTVVEIPDSLTLVKVRDYSLADYVDFEAISYLPEDPQIVQVEEFAVHIDSKGFIRYGLEVLAVNERDQNKVSLDHLPRVMVDILQDSTTIMETLLTNYQKSLLELIFQGKAKFRDKYFFLIANDLHCFERENTPISPELIQILCQPNYQDELNQITEEVKETSMFQDGTVLILGTHGSILVTRTPEKYEQMISDFLFVMDVEIFLNNFFARLFLMNDELKDIQKIIKNCEADPNAVSTVQQMLSRTSGDAILMEEVRGYLNESVALFQQKLADRYDRFPEEMQEILQSFRIPEMANGLLIRIQDIQKIIKGTQEYLQGLSQIIEVISERQMRRIQEALSNNTRSLEDMTKTNERSGMSLRILEIILAGSLAFSIMDHLTGSWEISVNHSFRQSLQTLLDIPGMWLLCSIGLWGVMALAIYLFMNWLEDVNTKALATRLKLDVLCDIAALQAYLKSKDVITHDADVLNISHLIKVSWEEKNKSHWLGNQPKIELIYDEKNGFLLSVLLDITRPTRSATSHKIQEIFLEDLRKAGVIKSHPLS